jgi:cytochrome c oxidase subunit 4
MSEHTVVEEHDTHEHAHPGPGAYVRIGVILFILTVMEVAVVYIQALAPVLLPILMVLMTVKFALVVLFFMHLKFDNRLFSTLFYAPLLIAVAIALALLALFYYRELLEPVQAAVTGGH